MTIQSSFYRAATLGIHVSRSRCSGLGVVCLLFSVLFLASVFNAGAQDITYNIVDYPANEGSGTGTDMIFGTITTDGTIGPLTAANIIGGSFSFADVEGDLISGPASFGAPVGLEATPTQLLLAPEVDSSFWISTTQAGPPLGAGITYGNYPGDGVYYGGVYPNGSTAVLYPFLSSPVPTDPGSIARKSGLDYRHGSGTGFTRASFHCIFGSLYSSLATALGPQCP